MKIVIAPDSFKEGLTALEVANAIEEGFREGLENSVNLLRKRNFFYKKESHRKNMSVEAPGKERKGSIFSKQKGVSFVKVPMADGGEGTVQSVVEAMNGELITVTVTGPLGESVSARYGLIEEGKTAIIEMAEASGIELVPAEKRNPEITTTFGTGELILSALNRGVERIIIGIGGSATNDGGAGMVEALGAKLLDKKGVPIPFGGAGLHQLAKIDLSGLDKRLGEVRMEVACDVNNPLTGPNGASYVYGPQKGATEEQLKQLDIALKNYAEVIRRDLGVDIEDMAGAGAAGGLGAALIAFCRAKLKRGGELVTDVVGLEEHVCDADLVITGEGGMNAQTIYGKTPICVAKVAKKYDVPVIAICGSLSRGYESVYEHGIDAVFSVVPGVVTLEEALGGGYENVKNTARNIAAVVGMGLIGEK